jgi:membrane-associated tyrosine/threonine-specific cdc2-inhibitory kinase
MELCPCGHIAHQHLAEDTVWQLIHDIASGLLRVHESGWMHLDVSPGNILKGEDMFKLADFGTLTKCGSFAEGCEGAGPFVSPEALDFPRCPFPVNGQTDIFSFGIVLLEALTGRLAPRGGSHGYGRIRKGDLVLGDQQYKCDCSEELIQLVNAMLSVNPTERPTAADLIAASVPHCTPKDA